MHWGPYSVPGVASEWFWFQWNRQDPHNPGDMEVVDYMSNNYPPNFKYHEFGPMFKAEFFNATWWADLVAASGAKYFVLTSKHHDGFSLWPSKYNFGWNSMDNGPKRDVIGELAEAFESLPSERSVKFGLYHSLFEWYHPLYLADKASNFSNNTFVREKVVPEMVELVEKYRPQVIWSDGDWEVGPEYWDSLEFLAWLYNSSPVKDTVVTNDRWGRGIMCHHGDFFTCSDRYNPGVLQSHKWENAMTVDKESWGHRRNMKMEDVLSMEELIETMASTVSCGGNLLVNVGPSSDGTISPIFEERLRHLGSWLSINGEAIYDSQPWSSQNDSLSGSTWYTSSKGGQEQAVYGIVLGWPSSGSQQLADVEGAEDTKIELLGYDGGQLQWSKRDPKGIEVVFPDKSKVTSQWGYVLKFSFLANGGNKVW